MERSELEKVILDQREETLRWTHRKIVNRSETALLNLQSDLAQVVLGVRRSGKSTLCQTALLKTKRPFAYLNFDDNRLIHFRGEDLDVALELLYKHYGAFDCLFLDEAQNVPEWHLFINRLLRQGHHVLVTGSNAKLLSGELATHMTGRYHRVELFPFSFKDYCLWEGVSPTGKSTRECGLRQGALDAYLRMGGFPELLREAGGAPEYLASLMNDVLERDIRQRYAIRQMGAFRDVATYLMDVAPTTLNCRTVAARLGNICSPNTVRTYVNYLKQAYLLQNVPKWSTKSHERLRGEKLYPVDVGFMDGRENALVGENLGWRLETTVLLELLRRHRSFLRTVCYFQGQRTEADFLVCAGRHVQEVVQVVYTLQTPRVREREIRGALAAAAATRCDHVTIVTYAEQDDLTVDGIHIRIRPAYDWLID